MNGYWKGGDPNWRRMEAMARRGWGRLAAGMEGGGDWGNMGGNFRIGRMLASGDVRLVALSLIEQQRIQPNSTVTGLAQTESQRESGTSRC